MKELFTNAVAILGNQGKKDLAPSMVAYAEAVDFVTEFMDSAKKLGIIDRYTFTPSERSSESKADSYFAAFSLNSEERFAGRPIKLKRGDFGVHLSAYADKETFWIATKSHQPYGSANIYDGSHCADFSSIQDPGFQSYMKNLADFAAKIAVSPRIVKAEQINPPSV